MKPFPTLIRPESVAQLRELLTDLKPLVLHVHPDPYTTEDQTVVVCQVCGDVEGHHPTCTYWLVSQLVTALERQQRGDLPHLVAEREVAHNCDNPDCTFDAEYFSNGAIECTVPPCLVGAVAVWAGMPIEAERNLTELAQEAFAP